MLGGRGVCLRGCLPGGVSARMNTQSGCLLVVEVLMVHLHFNNNNNNNNFISFEFCMLLYIDCGASLFTVN